MKETQVSLVGIS